MEKLGRNEPCWCGSGKKYKKCHEEFDNKIEEFEVMGHEVPDHSIIKTPAQIEAIKESCKINIAVLDEVAAKIHAGMTTQEIDDIVYKKTTEMGGIPATLNYEGYPKSVCTSINEVVCHGIPSDDVVLKDGDIVNVDCSTILNGYFSDSSRMFCIGDVSEEKRMAFLSLFSRWRMAGRLSVLYGRRREHGILYGRRWRQRAVLPRAETDAADFLLSGRCAAAIKTISAE